ncbi:MAG: hypothetical protein ACYC55_08460, partial [Candidatus Geothermincolia bacterium]
SQGPSKIVAGPWITERGKDERDTDEPPDALPMAAAGGGSPSRDMVTDVRPDYGRDKGATLSNNELDELKSLVLASSQDFTSETNNEKKPSLDELRAKVDGLIDWEPAGGQEGGDVPNDFCGITGEMKAAQEAKRSYLRRRFGRANDAESRTSDQSVDRAGTLRRTAAEDEPGMGVSDPLGGLESFFQGGDPDAPLLQVDLEQLERELLEDIGEGATTSRVAEPAPLSPDVSVESSRETDDNPAIEQTDEPTQTLDELEESLLLHLAQEEPQPDQGEAPEAAPVAELQAEAINEEVAEPLGLERAEALEPGIEQKSEPAETYLENASLAPLEGDTVVFDEARVFDAVATEAAPEVFRETEIEQPAAAGEFPDALTGESQGERAAEPDVAVSSEIESVFETETVIAPEPLNEVESVYAATDAFVEEQVAERQVGVVSEPALAEETEREPEPEPVAAAEPVAEEKTAALSEPGVALRPEPPPEAELAETEAIAERVWEPAQEAEPEEHQKVEPEAAIDPELEMGSEPAAVLEMEPAAAVAPVTEPEAEPFAEAAPTYEERSEEQPQPEPLPDAARVVEIEPAAEAEPEPLPEPEPIIAPEPVTEAEPVMEPEPPPEPEPVMEPEPPPEPEPVIEPEPAIATESVQEAEQPWRQEGQRSGYAETPPFMPQAPDWGAEAARSRQDEAAASPAAKEAAASETEPEVSVVFHEEREPRLGEVASPLGQPVEQPEAFDGPYETLFSESFVLERELLELTGAGEHPSQQRRQSRVVRKGSQERKDVSSKPQEQDKGKGKGKDNKDKGGFGRLRHKP